MSDSMEHWPIWVWIVLGLLSYGFVTAVAHMVTTRWAYMLKRHDLIVAARKRRIEYDQEQMIPDTPTPTGDVIIESDAAPRVPASTPVLEVTRDAD